jgi:hypothetical protein
VFEQSNFQRAIPVNRNNDPLLLAFLGENVVAAVDALEKPAALFG